MWMMMSVSAELCTLASLILTIDLALGLGSNQDMDFTFLLPAGSTECFFQPTSRQDRLEFEYQVIAGAGLDVGFTLISPGGYRLVSDFRRSDGLHVVDPTEEGDYRLCFDNSFSKMSEKMIFFKVLVDSQNNAGGALLDDWMGLAMPENLVEYKLEDIRAMMDIVYWNLERSRHVQSALRAFEARDRYLLEDNLWQVSFWSCVNLLVMLAVAVTQIYTLRHLFDGKRQICT